MDCEVVVVGGGIGGLTVAALLAGRGVSICLFERQSAVGGCAASLEKSGYSFEQGYGLYAHWRPGEIHDLVFSELPVDPPEVRLLEPSYVVRLPDQSEVTLTDNTERFEEDLRTVFPECADKAVAFYRNIAALSAVPKNIREPILHHLDGLSWRFRRFVDVQLQTFLQGDCASVDYLNAAIALNAPRDGLFAIGGGASTLAMRLSASITKSGGKVRLNTPVLRLAYDSNNKPVGVDLLSGETVKASRAIVSNLTVWDTYGKLVGLNRTPNEVRKRLSRMRGWGAYLIYLAMDEKAASRIPSSHILSLTDWQRKQDYEPQGRQFFFAAAPVWDARAPEGQRPVTVHTFTDVDEWFTFHADETELEERDQTMLEAAWAQLHLAMPELGGDVEAIETATPRDFYDSIRRKLGMVGGIIPTVPAELMPPGFLTHYPNVFIVSDTTSAAGIAGVTKLAWDLARKLTS